MPRSLLTLLLLFTMRLLPAQEDTARWRGGGDYPPGQPITTVMHKMGASKSIQLRSIGNGKWDGVLTALYDPARATIESQGVNQSFHILGEFYEDKHVLLLVLVAVMADSRNDVPFRKPDSVYYSYGTEETNGHTVLTGTANALMNRNSNAEWIGSSQRFGMGMNVSDPVGMHLLPLRIRLERESTKRREPPTQTAAQPGKSSPAQPPAVTRADPPPATRSTEVQRTIYLDSNAIRIDLYDNGTIDGDVATLLLDGKPIIENKLLGTRAATISLILPRLPAEHVLELFAVTLGSIPPNSAMVVLTCNRKRFEINLSSTLTVNGSVKLVVSGKR